MLNKIDYPAGKLSGGQKRKLCVAIAFIGGSDVILLDEPTSGMDTYARRHLWEMIKNYKKDKIIILTTHFMDEADFLGDRIGIMGEGKLKTCGSSLFLKKKFGVGYVLTVVKTEASVDSKNITNIVSSYVPNYKIVGDISMEIKYQLPSSNSGNFEKLFKLLEEGQNELGIQTFGINLTSLEDVFLNVALASSAEEKELEDKHPSLAESDDISLKYDESDNFKLEDVRIKGACSIFFKHFRALSNKRFLYFKKDIKGIIWEIFVPMIVVTIGLSLTKIEFVKESTGRNLSNNIWGTIPIINLNTGTFFDDFNKTLADYGTVKSLDGVTKYDDFAELVLKSKSELNYYNIYIEDIVEEDKIYTVDMAFNSTVRYSIPVGANALSNAILQHATNNKKAYIKVEIDPFPVPISTKSLEKSVDGFMAVMLIALAYSFIPASNIISIVKERENNAKHQQIVSGVSVQAYWLSNFVIDYIKYLVPALYTGGAAYLFEIDAFTKVPDTAAMMWSLLLVYGVSLTWFTYIVSFMFKSPSTAQTFIFMFTYFSSFVLLMVAFMMRIIPTTRSLSYDILEWIYRLIPPFDFCFGLLNITSLKTWRFVFDLSTEPTAWSSYGAITELTYMWFLWAIMYIIIIFIELEINPCGWLKKKHIISESAPVDLVDEDLIKERENMIKNNENFVVRVLDLNKTYTYFSENKLQSKTAVKGISFGVRKGE